MAKLCTVIVGTGKPDKSLADLSPLEERAISQQGITLKLLCDGKPPLFLKSDSDGFVEYSIEDYSVDGLSKGTDVVSGYDTPGAVQGTVVKIGRSLRDGTATKEDIQVFIKLVRTSERY